MTDDRLTELIALPLTHAHRVKIMHTHTHYVVIIGVGLWQQCLRQVSCKPLLTTTSDERPHCL